MERLRHFRETITIPPKESRMRETILTHATALLGAPSYNKKRGGDGACATRGLSCSGFVHEVLKRSGVGYRDEEGGLMVPRHLEQQRDWSRPVERQHVRPGDLGFVLENRFGEMHPKHVVIMTDPEKDEFIHSPGSNGCAVEYDHVIYAPYDPTNHSQTLAFIYARVVDAPWSMSG